MKFIISFVLLLQAYQLKGQSTSLSLGVIESIDELIKIDQNLTRDLLNTYKHAPIIDSLKQMNDPASNYTIDQRFLQSILFNTQQSFFKISDPNKCNFYELMWFGLLRNSKETVLNVPVLLKKESGITYQQINAKILAEYLSKESCIDSFSLFNKLKKINFSELKKNLPLDYPKNKTECRQIHSNINKSIYRNYILSIANLIRDAQILSISKDPSISDKKTIILYKKIQKGLNLNELELIKNFYNYIDSKKQFCDSFFDKSFFAEAKNNPGNFTYILDPICQGIKKKFSKLSINEYIKCLDTIKENESTCFDANSLHNPSLYPQLECSQIIDNALNSLLSHYGSDCPAAIYNEGVVNAGRVLQYYNGYNTQKYNKDSPGCLTEPLLSFVSFAKEMGLEKAWKTQVCYQSKLLRKEICYDSVFLNSQSLDFSINNIVSKILFETKRTKNKTKCLFISDSDTGSSSLLKRKGCYISYSSKTCKLDQCQFDIYLNERKLDRFITTKSESSFHLIPSNFNNKQFSFHNILKRKYSLKESKIYNLTQLKEVSARKNSLTYGVGCAEDLLPNLFLKRTINQCKPLPFIISGIMKSKNLITDEVMVNLSIDSLNITRSFNWKTIFATTKNYQKNHPTRYWSLYAIYQ